MAINFDISLGDKKKKRILDILSNIMTDDKNQSDQDSFSMPSSTLTATETPTQQVQNLQPNSGTDYSKLTSEQIQNKFIIPEADPMLLVQPKLDILGEYTPTPDYSKLQPKQFKTLEDRFLIKDRDTPQELNPNFSYGVDFPKMEDLNSNDPAVRAQAFRQLEARRMQESITSQPPPPVLDPTPRDRINESYNKIENLINTPVFDNDKGWKKQLFSVLREAVINAANAYDSTQGTPDQKLMAAIGGAVGGGLVGKFDKTVDERRARDAKILQERIKQGLAQEEEDYQFNSQIRDIQLNNLKLQPYFQAMQREAEKQKFMAEQAMEQRKLNLQVIKELNDQNKVRFTNLGEDYIGVERGPSGTIIPKPNTKKIESSAAFDSTGLIPSEKSIDIKSELAKYNVIKTYLEQNPGSIKVTKEFEDWARKLSQPDGSTYVKFDGSLDLNKLFSDISIGKLVGFPPVQVYEKGSIPPEVEKTAEAAAAQTKLTYIKRRDQLESLGKTIEAKLKELGDSAIAAQVWSNVRQILSQGDVLEDFNTYVKYINEVIKKLDERINKKYSAQISDQKSEQK
jgi:hypothetical protein